jgi:hypothetical protein
VNEDEVEEEDDGLEVYDPPVDSLDDDEDDRHGEILESDENGAIIRIGRRAHDVGDDDEGEEEADGDDPEEVPANPVVAAEGEPGEGVPSEPAPVAAAGDPVPPGEREEEPAPGPYQAPTVNGFALRGDGLALLDVAYEDANSPEALALIYGEEDATTGESLSDGIGEREYARRCSAYEVTKAQYAQKVEQQVETAIYTGLNAVREEIETLPDHLARVMKIPKESVAGFESFTARAIELIDQDRAERQAAYERSGYDTTTSIRLADKDVLSHKGLFKVMFDEIAFNLRLAEREKAGKPATPPAPAAPPAPAPPPTSTGGAAAPVAGSARLTREDLKKYPRALLEVARQTGIHPDKLL